MASLTYSDRSVIESHVGELSAEGATDAEDRLDRLGSAEGVALELLMTRRAYMRMNASKLKSADDSVDWSVNLAMLDVAIRQLAEYLFSDGDLIPGSALEKLVGQALGHSKSLDDLDFGLSVKSSNYRQT